MNYALVLLFLILSSCQNLPVGINSTDVVKYKTTEIILDHKYFIVSYNPETRLPNWVSYHLYAKNLRNKVAKRKNKFFADPELIKMSVPYAKPDSFDSSVYDRGHMAPSEDFTFDQNANDETFVMTNMAPQAKKLNRGPWKALETKVRKWACTEGELLVISGPITELSLDKFPSGVVIPKRFFKIILDETPPRKTIGFIYNQTDRGDVLEKNKVSIKDVEKIVGNQFFKDLNGSEVLIDSDISHWVESDCMKIK